MIQTNIAKEITIKGKKFLTDSNFNIPTKLLQFIDNYSLVKHHPVQLIGDHFRKTLGVGFQSVVPYFPVVTVKENFDYLGIPENHPSRKLQDTYYINSNELLRTSTSAHQVEVITESAKSFLQVLKSLNPSFSSGATIMADVYRKDTIDRTHSSIFHQMEGLKIFKDVIPSNYVMDHGPWQNGHDPLKASTVLADLKSTVESCVKQIVPNVEDMRWTPDYFPFTQPSLELEILFGGKWMEVCGCGIIQQFIMNQAGHGDHIGWAFGFGLERLAMLRFGIQDIRLFWTRDPRFLTQFEVSGIDTKFSSLSKYPPVFRDISFYIPPNFEENGWMEMIREDIGDLVESIEKTDEFTHPKNGKSSRTYKITYRSMDGLLTNEQVNDIHEKLRKDSTDLMKTAPVVPFDLHGLQITVRKVENRNEIANIEYENETLEGRIDS